MVTTNEPNSDQRKGNDMMDQQRFDEIQAVVVAYEAKHGEHALPPTWELEDCLTYINPDLTSVPQPDLHQTSIDKATSFLRETGVSIEDFRDWTAERLERDRDEADMDDGEPSAEEENSPDDGTADNDPTSDDDDDDLEDPDDPDATR